MTCILISLIIVAVAMSFTYRVRQKLRLALVVEDRVQADLRAWSVMQEVLFILSTTLYTTNGTYVPWSEQRRQFRIGGPSLDSRVFLNFYGKEAHWGDDATVTIEDMSSKLSFIDAGSRRLQKLLEYHGLKPGVIGKIIDGLMDWQDADDFKRLNGAESWDYRMSEKGYGPRNWYCQVPEELLLIEGMTPEILDKIQQDVVLFNGGFFNYLNASPALLRALFAPHFQMADLVVSYREQGLLNRHLFAQITGIAGGEGLSFTPGNKFRVVVRARHGQGASQIEIIYNNSETLKTPFQIELWRR